MIGDLLGSETTVELSRRRFTVTDYMRLAESGILAEEERVELIRGEIVETPPISIAHVSIKMHLVALFTRTFADWALVGINNPVQLDEFSLPQPDVVLLRSRENYYSDRHPGPNDVMLVIEIADASIDYDRWVKAPLFGSSGVMEFWIINVPAQQIEVYRDPRPNGYRTATIYASAEEVSPLAFPDVSLCLNTILGTST